MTEAVVRVAEASGAVLCLGALDLVKPAEKPASESAVSEGGGSLIEHGPFVLGDYVLHERLGQGGMASVYLAERAGSEGFRKWFAVKVIRPHLAGDVGFVTMFLDEARLLSRFNHPNVCAVFDAGTARGMHYLAMEFLQGASLSEVLKVLRGAGTLIAPHIAARIISDAARGLHAAHQLENPDGSLAQVIHRDVSPQNIFVLYEGITKVVDFGVAHSRERLAENTHSGVVKGKPAYLSPEQLGDGPVDRRTDIFALGVVFWEATMGRRLFRRDTEAATMRAVLMADIEDPRVSHPGFPAELARIMMKMLQRDPEKRFATADQVARNLDGYFSTSGEASGVTDVADYLRTLFADRIELETLRIRKLSASPVIPRQRPAIAPVVEAASPRPTPVGSAISQETAEVHTATAERITNTAVERRLAAGALPEAPAETSPETLPETPSDGTPRRVHGRDVSVPPAVSDATVVLPRPERRRPSTSWTLVVLGALAVVFTAAAVHSVGEFLQRSSAGRQSASPVRLQATVFSSASAPSATPAAPSEATDAGPEALRPAVIEAPHPHPSPRTPPRPPPPLDAAHDRPRALQPPRAPRTGARHRPPGLWITNYDSPSR